MYPASPMGTTFPPPPPPPPSPPPSPAPPREARTTSATLLGHFHFLGPKPEDQSPSMSIRRSWGQEPPLHLVPRTIRKQQFLLSIRYQSRFDEGVALHVSYSLLHFWRCWEHPLDTEDASPVYPVFSRTTTSISGVEGKV